MKLALVIYRSDPARGGAERYTADLAVALTARGHGPVILASDASAGVRLDASGLTRTRQYTRFLDSLDQHLSANRYDIVHAMLPVRRCDVYHPHAGIAAEAIATGHRKHGSPLRQLLSKLGNRLNAKRRRFAQVEREMLARADGPVAAGDGPQGGRQSQLMNERLLSARPTDPTSADDPSKRVGSVEEPPGELPLRNVILGSSADRLPGVVTMPCVRPVVLCLSDYVRRSAQRCYELPQDRLATLFNGIDLRRFDPGQRPAAGQQMRVRHGIEAGSIVALMIAQDFERKGLPEAIAALRSAGDPRLVLLVVGRDDPVPYQRMARIAGVSEQVIFAGGTDDPGAYYLGADFFLLPTHHDPCSLVVLESLAMGLPVITTMRNGAAEIMRDGEHGFVIGDAGEIDAITSAMWTMLDPAERARMRSACLELRPQLSHEAHIDRLLAIYEQVLHGR